MAKRLLIVFFLSSLGIALWQFWGRDVRPIRYSLAEQDAGEPGVKFQRFRFSRFDRHMEIARISGDDAALYAPNLLEINGNVWAWRAAGESRQTIRTQSAQLFFDSTSISELMRSTQLELGYVKDQVVIESAGDQLFTDFAKFVAAKSVLLSHRPVETRGMGRWFRGKEGFEYHLGSEELQIFGPITGVVVPRKRDERK